MLEELSIRKLPFLATLTSNSRNDVLGSCILREKILRLGAGIVMLALALPDLFAGKSGELTETFNWEKNGTLFQRGQKAGAGATTHRSESSAWTWGAYSANREGRAVIDAREHKLIFQRNGRNSSNVPGSYAYAVFPARMASPFGDGSIDLSRLGAVFKIRARVVSSDQALRWMIRDAAGSWYLSREVTWPRRLPISKQSDHFWTYPVSLYSWSRVLHPDLNALPPAGGDRGLKLGEPAQPDLTRVSGVGVCVARSSGDASLVIDGLGLSPYEPIVYAPPNRATHWFTGPNGLRVGLGELSGGIFNEMYWGASDPATGREINLIPGMNGRAVNFAFRSKYHRGVWNPIQSGHWEEFGRPVDITIREGELGRRYEWGPIAMPLWHGDGDYDFSQYEDLTYGYPYATQPAHRDADTLPEKGLSQADEIISDFDLSGFYEDVSSVSPGVLALRIVQRADFVRLTDNTRQFNARGRLIDGRTSVIDPSTWVEDISPLLPGNQSSSETDMTQIPMIWSDRFDRQFGQMKWLWIWHPKADTWEIVPLDKWRDTNVTSETLTVITDSGNLADADVCRGVGLYYPAWSEINQYPIVGIETASGGVVYEERRPYSAEPVVQITSWRADRKPQGENGDISGDFTMRSLRIFIQGMLSPNHTLIGCHERIQKENYWIFGPPSVIRKAVAAIDDRFSPMQPSGLGKARLTAMPGELLIASGSTEVSLDAELLWWPGLRSSTSELYVDTDAARVAAAGPGDPAFRGSVTGRSHVLASLQPGTTYYWRVDARNATGVIKGDVWSFSTISRRQAAVSGGN